MGDFGDFQKYFKEYQQRFGLSGYTVYFKYEPIDGRFADIGGNQNQMVVTVRLNSKLGKDEEPFKDIKGSAKHEALHLLLFRLQHIAESRYLGEEEIVESLEELVNKLDALIP